MLTQQYILNELRTQMPLLRSMYFVSDIALFGSFARNEATEGSDIDFLVQLNPPLEKYLETKEALRVYLSKLFHRNIDLANPRSLKPHYKEIILKQAVHA